LSMAGYSHSVPIPPPGVAPQGWAPPSESCGIQLLMPTTAPAAKGNQFLHDLTAMDQSGRELFNSVAQNPFAQIAAGYGKNVLANSRFTSFFSLEPFKYYFNVNNSYVLNKIKVLLCPYLHKSWKRQKIRKDEQEFFCPPRDDVNAPDLYIPAMAFVTYVLLVGFVMGTNGKFAPELLGTYSSRGFVIVLLECLFVRAGFYFFENAVTVNLLDVVAYCSYLFVMLIINILVGFMFGGLSYYVCWFITSLFMATFMVRTLVRLVVLPDQSGGMRRSERNGFLMSIAALQFIVSWLLGVLL